MTGRGVECAGRVQLLDAAADIDGLHPPKGNREVIEQVRPIDCFAIVRAYARRGWT